MALAHESSRAWCFSRRQMAGENIRPFLTSVMNVTMLATYPMQVNANWNRSSVTDHNSSPDASVSSLASSSVRAFVAFSTE